jgi:hypothetical protein
MRPLVAVTLASLALTASSVAHAAPPDAVEVAVSPGLMTKPSGNDGSAVGLGFGARGGAMIEGFYFGARVINYWGGSQSAGQTPSGLGAPGATTSSSTLGTEYLLYGVELGYSFTLFHLLLLRPQVGGGIVNTTSTCTIPDGSGGSIHCSGDTTQGPYFEPGVTALVPLGRFLFTGLDANLLMLFEGGSPAFTMHAQLGIRF